MTQPDDYTVDPTQDPARTPHPDPAVDPEQDPALGPTQEGALDPAPDPAEAHPVAEGDLLQDQELTDAARTSEDEYSRPADDFAGEQSIDDALETDRVAAEGADSRNADGFRFDETRERGLEDVAAADQGNRDEDRMVGDGDEVDEVGELAGTDAAGTDRDLADPDSVGAGESGQLTDPEPGPADLD